jgi:hypothetical protein
VILIINVIKLIYANTIKLVLQVLPALLVPQVPLARQEQQVSKEIRALKVPLAPKAILVNKDLAAHVDVLVYEAL